MILRTVQETIHKTRVLPEIVRREYLPPIVADSSAVEKAIDEAYSGNVVLPTTYSTTATYENESSEQTIPQEVQDNSLQTEPEIQQISTPQVVQSQIVIPQSQSLIVPIQNQSQILIPTNISQPQITQSLPLVNMLVPQPTQIIQPIPQQTQIIQPLPQPTQIIQPIPQPTQIIQPVPQPTQIIQPVPQVTPLLGQTVIMPIGPIAITTQPLFVNTYHAATY